MERIKRNWFKAIEKGIDGRLIVFLLKLKVITISQHTQYLAAMRDSLYEYQQERRLRKARTDTSQPYTSQRGPKQIKPTRARR